MGNNGGGNGYKPFVSDEWTLYPAVFGEDLTEEQENDLTLIDLLALEEKEFDLSQSPTTISTRFTQPTLTALLHLISRAQRVSVSKVERVATKQGLRLIRGEKGYTAVQKNFSTRLEGVRTRYDADGNARIGRASKLLPSDISNDRSNIRVYSWVHSALADEGYNIGVYPSHFAAFCLLYSLATITDLGAYMPTVLQDIDRFRRHLNIRAEELITVETLRR